jgi:hypothetical protein
LGSGEAMRIDSSGNVGIGTTSADEVLEVAGDVKSSGGNFGIYHFGETSDVTKIVGRDGSHASLPNTMDFFTNSTQRMRIDSSGNVGIGTSSPESTLEISKNDQTNGATLSITNAFNGGSWSSGDTIGKIDFRTDDVSTTEPVRASIKVFDDLSGGSNTYPYASALSISTTLSNTATERMRIDSSGRVGIGTSSPSAKLEIEDTDFARLDLNLSNATGTTIADVRGLVAGTEKWRIGKTASSSDDFTINVTGTERMRINSSGELLVGRTTATGGGSVADDAQAYFNGAVNRAGVPFTDFNDVWVNLNGGIIEGKSGFQPSNRPSGAGNWFHVTAYSNNTGGSTIYVTQVCTSITGGIFTRYNTGITTGGSWSNWVEK